LSIIEKPTGVISFIENKKVTLVSINTCDGMTFGIFLAETGAFHETKVNMA
jgi:hypothetical protein